jgi:hypothetical protein
MNAAFCISKMFQNAFKKEYFETYWAFDVHGVILRPNYRVEPLEAEFYPFAKETLQLLSTRKDIVLILFTSSYPKELEFYLKIFEENDIKFKYINENPEVDSSMGNFGDYTKKFYFNLMFEDKAGFLPEEHWEPILNLLLEYEKLNYKPNSKWTTKR